MQNSRTHAGVSAPRSQQIINVTSLETGLAAVVASSDMVAAAADDGEVEPAIEAATDDIEAAAAAEIELADGCVTGRMIQPLHNTLPRVTLPRGSGRHNL